MTPKPMAMEAETAEALDLRALNRSQIARDTGYHLTHISRVLNRKVRPSFDLIIRIANSIGCTTDQLMSALAEKAEGN